MFNFFNEIKVIVANQLLLLLTVLILIVLSGFIQASSLFGLMPIIEFALNDNLDSSNNLIKIVSMYSADFSPGLMPGI